MVCYILPAFHDVKFFGSGFLIHSIINSGHTAAYNHFFLIGNEKGKGVLRKKIVKCIMVALKLTISWFKI